MVCRGARSLKKQWSEVCLCGKESGGGGRVERTISFPILFRHPLFVFLSLNIQIFQISCSYLPFVILGSHCNLISTPGASGISL